MVEKIKTVGDYLKVLEDLGVYESPVFRSPKNLTGGGITLYRVEERTEKYLKVQPLRQKKSSLEALEPIHILRWQHKNDPVVES